ncbi:hypothetical protein [Vibrio phage vB_VpaP_SJSY21]|nr:hypothetical protein [Vibrio phage vB_VpaP_SJSY21]
MFLIKNQLSQGVVTEACKLLQCQLFIYPHEELKASNVKMAVNYYGTNDHDVHYVYPFLSKQMDGDSLPYLSNDAEVMTVVANVDSLT